MWDAKRKKNNNNKISINEDQSLNDTVFKKKGGVLCSSLPCFAE